jgi:hypothetical protein
VELGSKGRVEEEEAGGEEAEEAEAEGGRRRGGGGGTGPSDLLDLLDLLDLGPKDTLIWIRRNIPLTGTGNRTTPFRVMYWGHCYRSYSTPANPVAAANMMGMTASLIVQYYSLFFKMYALNVVSILYMYIHYDLRSSAFTSPDKRQCTMHV